MIVPAKIYNIPRPQTNRKMLKLRVTMFRMCARALSGFGARNRPSNTKMKSDIMTTQTDMTIDFGSHASGYNTTATIDVTISASAPKTFTGQKKNKVRNQSNCSSESYQQWPSSRTKLTGGDTYECRSLFCFKFPLHQMPIEQTVQMRLLTIAV